MTERLLNAVLALATGGAKAWAALKHVFMNASVQPRRYHPEAHYMRGPGPKWRAKHAKVPAQSR